MPVLNDKLINNPKLIQYLEQQKFSLTISVSMLHVFVCLFTGQNFYIIYDTAILFFQIITKHEGFKAGLLFIFNIIRLI